jgi:raffinose/stachyose/melibiose transport system substrate-binding protein
MKRFLEKQSIRAIALVSFFGLFSFCFQSCEKTADPISLTVTSWRVDDMAEMNRIHALFTKTHPNITINFQPVETILYPAAMAEKLKKGTAEDLIYLRPFEVGRAFYEDGYLDDLTLEISGLDKYSAINLKAWTNKDGVIYGVPSMGVTHGVYYNKSIFQKYGIQVPATWNEFIAACEKLRLGGETVIAQGAVTDWPLYEIVYSGIGANFYGGEVSRQELMAGTMKMTDPKFLSAFDMVQSLKKYFPAGFETKTYEQMREIFATGKAAIFFSGSWEISVFEGYGMTSEDIGWFAPPVINAGDKVQYVLNVDAGIGLNKNCKNKEAALEYIKWVASAEYAQALMTELPGFISLTPGTFTVSNPLAQQMFEVSATADLTIRLMAERLSAQSPAGSALMGESLIGLLTGIYTPASAAAYVQTQLDTWYKPGGMK